MKKDKKFKITKELKIAIWISVIAIIIIPSIINLCYIFNKGIPTVWDGADLLAFYGAIIGTIGTIVLGYVSWKQNSRLLKIEENQFINENLCTLVLNYINVAGFTPALTTFACDPNQIVKTDSAEIEGNFALNTLNIAFTFDVIDNYPNYVKVNRVLIFAENEEIFSLNATSIDTEFSYIALTNGEIIFKCTLAMSEKEKNKFISAIVNTNNPILIESEFQVASSKFVVSKIRAKAKLYKELRRTQNDGVYFYTDDRFPGVCFSLGYEVKNKEDIIIKEITPKE